MKNHTELTVNLSSKITPESAYAFLFSLFWTQKTLISYFRSILVRIPYFSFLADTIIGLVFGIAVICSISYIIKGVRIQDVIFYAIIALAMYLTATKSQFDVTSIYISKNGLEIMLSVVPLFFIGLGYYKGEIENKLYILSVLSIYATVIYVIIFGMGVGLSEDNIGKAYNILPHVCLVLFYCLEHYSLFKLGTVTIGALLLLSFGCRGAFLLLFALLITYLIFFKEYKRRALAIITLVIIFILFTFLFDYIIQLLGGIVSALGLGTRIVDSLRSESFFIGNGRENIIQAMLYQIQANPFRIIGVAGDRSFARVYAHNYLVELLVSYGIIIGLAIFVTTILILVVGIIRAKSRLERGFLLSLVFSGGFLKLFLSSSYLLEPNFFLLIGICITIIRRGKRTPE